MPLYFVPTESAFAYFEATRAYLERSGQCVRTALHCRLQRAFHQRAAARVRCASAVRADEDLDLLQHVDTAAIVESKRLSHALQAALVIHRPTKRSAQGG